MKLYVVKVKSLVSEEVVFVSSPRPWKSLCEAESKAALWPAEKFVVVVEPVARHGERMPAAAPEVNKFRPGYGV